MFILKTVNRQAWAPTIRHYSKLGPTLKLNDGWLLPIIGLGTFQSPPDKVTQAVKNAICVGYRHIDTAWFYKNEIEVGKAIEAKIADCTIKRKDIFVTTKLWNNFHRRHRVVPMLEESLKNLGLTYVDLYLIHWPMGFKESGSLLPKSPSEYCPTDYLDTWRGMEQCVDKGLTKSIGLSNFNSEQIARVLENCRIKPVVNQIEVNPNFAQNDLIAFCKDSKIVVVGFSPLGSVGSAQKIGPTFPKPTIQDPRVCEMTKKYHRTAAQIVLNFLITKGIAVIPKSVTKKRIEKNLDVCCFQLEEADVEYLKSLDKKDRRIWRMEAYKDHEHYPFSIPF